MMATLAPSTTRIVELNDRCRMGLDRSARIVATRDCLATDVTNEISRPWKRSAFWLTIRKSERSRRN